MCVTDSVGSLLTGWTVNSCDAASQTRKSMADVYQDYPRGHYLSDGAYKEVHKVFSTRHKRLEAVSVMDIGAIASTGNQVRSSSRWMLGGEERETDALSVYMFV